MRTYFRCLYYNTPAGKVQGIGKKIHKVFFAEGGGTKLGMRNEIQNYELRIVSRETSSRPPALCPSSNARLKRCRRPRSLLRAWVKLHVGDRARLTPCLVFQIRTPTRRAGMGGRPSMRKRASPSILFHQIQCGIHRRNVTSEQTSPQISGISILLSHFSCAERTIASMIAWL